MNRLAIVKVGIGVCYVSGVAQGTSACIIPPAIIALSLAAAATTTSKRQRCRHYNNSSSVDRNILNAADDDKDEDQNMNSSMSIIYEINVFLVYNCDLWNCVCGICNIFYCNERIDLLQYNRIQYNLYIPILSNELFIIVHHVLYFS